MAKIALPKHLTHLEALEAIYGPPSTILTAENLRPYQAWMADAIKTLPGVLMGAEPGLGKSGATLKGFSDLFGSGEITQLLIVAPLYVAEETWPAEIAKWAFARRLSYRVVTGSEVERIAAMNYGPCDVTIINRENLVWLYERLGLAEWPFDGLVYDESSRLQRGALKTKPVQRQDGTMSDPALTELGVIDKVRAKTKRIVLLSGTPAPGGLVSLWGQMFAVDGGQRLGTSKSAFDKRWFMLDRNFKAVTPLPHAQAEITDRIKDRFFALREEDYLTLPPLVENDHEITLSDAELRAYRKFQRDMAITMYDENGDPDVIQAVNSGVLTGKLQQFARGAVYGSEGKVHPVHGHKIDRLKTIFYEANGTPLLVAYGFRYERDEIKAAFGKACRVFGETKTDMRDWNEGRVPLLLIHPACLHPRTEVLTEHRGWVKIIDVGQQERVFDGVEFVRHGGCRYSGYREVIDVFGISMTPEHKLLIGGRWVEAKYVRDDSEAKEQAKYEWQANANGFGSMREMRQRSRDAGSELSEAQSCSTNTLSALHHGSIPLPHRDSYMERLEWSALPLPRYLGQKLRRSRYLRLRGLEQVRELLSRYGFYLPKRSNVRARGREQRLLERELYVGLGSGAAGQQEEQSRLDLRGTGVSHGRSLSVYGNKQDAFDSQIGEGDDTRRCGGGRSSLHLRNGAPCDRKKAGADQGEGTQSARARAHVYDLVDCGPRSRFLVRNADGEVFVSHNSAAHGLNFQYGSNIVVFYSLPWSMELYGQAMKRLHRSGQPRDKVFLHRLIVNGTVDAKVLPVLNSKIATEGEIKAAVLADLDREWVA